MCFRKKKPELILKPKTYLGFSINDYPGGNNDLNGCVNDQADMSDMVASLKELCPDIAINCFKNSEVTGAKFEEVLKKAFTTLPGVPVFFLSDSCFSESNTRALIKSRSIKLPDTPIMGKVMRKTFRLGNEIGNWFTISGCRENETSADAFIDGRYNGACTRALLESYQMGITYGKWMELGNIWLAKNRFEQRMTFDGMGFYDKVAFADPVIFVHYSGHGTTVKDIHGDEADGVDECLYFYDGIYLDDRINNLLQLIKY